MVEEYLKSLRVEDFREIIQDRYKWQRVVMAVKILESRHARRRRRRRRISYKYQNLCACIHIKIQYLHQMNNTILLKL